MGKAGVRTIVVRKWMTLLLLIGTTVVIGATTLWLSGKAYAKVDPIPLREVRVLARKFSEGPMPTATVIALIMPMILNILLFLPWGFLMFILMDKPERPTNQSYLLTILFALAFSLSIEALQYFLPTRVTDINDVIWNGVGALVGAVLGHLRKRVRVAFD